MNGNRRYSMLAGTLAAAAALALSAGGAAAQNGTIARRTLTFSTSPTATVTFGIQSLLVSDPGSPPTTIVQLEFGREGSNAVVDPGLGTGVNFTLTRTSAGGGTLSFPITSLPSGNTSIGGKEISMARTDPTGTPGLLSLTIAHTASTAAAETWSLQITGLPTPTPPIRGIASLFGASTGFSTLVPVGVCGSGTCPSVCPPGESCRGPCPLKPCLGPIRIYYPEIIWPLPFPPGPWPCLSCPIPWLTEFDTGEFERVVVTFLPTPEQRLAFERGQTRDIQFSATGGALIGEVLEGSAGEFMQMVQYPIGQPALVSVSAGGTTLGEFRAEPPLSADARMYRNLAYALGALLLAAVIGLGLMARRRGPGGRAVQG